MYVHAREVADRFDIAYATAVKWFRLGVVPDATKDKRGFWCAPAESLDKIERRTANGPPPHKEGYWYVPDIMREFEVAESTAITWFRRGIIPDAKKDRRGRWHTKAGVEITRPRQSTGRRVKDLRARLMNEVALRLKKGQSPTQEELAEALGVSHMAILHHLTELEKMGQLTWTRGTPRSLRLTN